MPVGGMAATPDVEANHDHARGYGRARKRAARNMSDPERGVLRTGGLQETGKLRHGDVSEQHTTKERFPRFVVTAYAPQCQRQGVARGMEDVTVEIARRGQGPIGGAG